MSLILDALKRAERERRLERPPDLTAVYEEDRPPRRGSRPWLWLSGAFVISAIAVGLILWPEAPGPARPPVSKESVVERSASVAGSPEKAQTTPSPASPKGTRPKTAGTPAAETPPARPALTPIQTPPPPPAPDPVQAAPPPPGAPVVPTQETAPEQPVAPPAPSAPEGALPEPAPPEPAPLEPPPTGVPKAKAGPAKSAPIPLLSELPFEVREKLGQLQINVHSYSENPAERLVFINMKSFKVGERIGENGPILKEITPEGVIIDYGEGQTRVQVRN